MTAQAAIFDVDRTILDGMSGRFFVDFLWEHGELPLRNRLRIITQIAGYRLALLPDTALVEIGVTFCAGLPRNRLEGLGFECARTRLHPRLYQEALETIKGHREKGRRVYLASGSTDLIVAPLAEVVGADGYVASSSWDDGLLCTKQVRYPICYRQGKLELIHAALAPHGIALENCHLYSDNFSDISLFEKVGHRHAVNPSAKLAKRAEAEGWEILTWNTPKDSTHRVSGGSWPMK